MFKKVEAPYMTSAGLKVEDSVIAISKMDELYVKNYTMADKIKRSLLIGFVFGFVGILLHPIYAGLPMFVIIFIIAYVMAPQVELRTVLSPTADVGSVDTGLHKSSDPHDYIAVVEKFHALKAYEEMTSHHEQQDFME